jgi:hypothetical protein
MDPGAINHVLPLILSAMSSRATFVRVEVPPHTPIMPNYVNQSMSAQGPRGGISVHLLTESITRRRVLCCSRFLGHVGSQRYGGDPCDVCAYRE